MRGLFVTFDSHVTLQATTGAGYTYVWYRNGHPVPITTSSVTTGKSGSYMVLISIPGGCSDLSDPVTITVYPAVHPSIYVAGSTDLCNNDPVKMKTNPGSGLSFQWNKEGIPIVGANDFFYFATVTGHYNCTVTNSYGCSNNTAYVNVVNSCRTTDMEAKTPQLEIYPNPTFGEFTIYLQLPGCRETSATVSIYDMFGNQIYQSSADIAGDELLDHLELDAHIAGGMYYVKVIIGDQEYLRQLILVH